MDDNIGSFFRQHKYAVIAISCPHLSAESFCVR